MEKKSAYRRWTQYNLEYTERIMWLIRNHGTAAALYFFLVDQMDDYNAVLCSNQIMQEILGLGRTAVFNAIKALRNH